MNTRVEGPEEAAPCFGQGKPVAYRAPLAGHPKGRTPCAAPLGYSNQTWPRRIGYRNCVMRRGWFNVWFALAIALSLFAARSHAQSEFAYVANSFDDNVSGYTINPTTGALTRIAVSPFAPGFRPTSVAVDPSRKFAYTANFSDNVSGYT